MLVIIYLFCSVYTCFSLKAETGEERLVIEEDSDMGSRTAKAISRGRGQELLCSSGSHCILLSNCRVMAQLMEKSCLQTTKLRQLTCGYKDNQPMVCCPQYCPVNPNQEEPLTCGIPKSTSSWQHKSLLGIHPWAVRVGFKNKLSQIKDHLCVGSIVNKRVILTAAHCALAKTVTHKIASVRVGDYDGLTNPDCSDSYCAPSYRDISLSHIIVHPGYDGKTYRHNIALLVLKEAINYTDTARPICLPQKNGGLDSDWKRATLVGWGKLSDQYGASQLQQQIEMPLLPRERCKSVYGSTVSLSDEILCVGGEGKDACSGFGGAPLVIKVYGMDEKYYQIGLVSFGADKCGEIGIPSVYTRIEKYVDWITANSPRDVT